MVGDGIPPILSPDGDPLEFLGSAPRVASLQHGTKEMGLGVQKRWVHHKVPCIVKPGQKPHTIHAITEAEGRASLGW